MMKSLDLSAKLPTAGLASDGSARPAATGGSPEAALVRRVQVDGTDWFVRGGFDRVLQSITAAGWSHPTQQGWTYAKHNAIRHVYRAQIGESSYYFKYFLRATGVRGLKRLVRGPVGVAEWNGALYALRHEIAAARPAGFAPDVLLDGRPHSLLVTEAIEPAYPLCDYWQTLRRDPDPLRRRTDCDTLIELLAEMIARAHQSGFEHLDMHAGNILVQPLGSRRYRTAFIDLQSAQFGAPLGDGSVVRNLAQLNQWFRRHSSVGDRLRFLRAYWRRRDEFEGRLPHSRPLGMPFGDLVHALETHADSHARRLWRQRDRKALRDGRYFARLRLAGGWSASVVIEPKRRVGESKCAAAPLDREWWRAQLADPLRWFHAGNATTLKDSHSAQVARALLPADGRDLPVIIKRPIARDWRRALRLMLPESRCRRAWRMGHALLHRDIPTARPLALVERRLGPLVRDSVLLTEAIPGAVDLESYLRAAPSSDERSWRRRKNEICELLSRELRRFHDCGLVHRDCKAQNLLVLDAPALKLYWIDMDGVRISRRRDDAAELRALVRLHVSLLEVPGLTRTDRVRVLKAYAARFGAAPDRWRGMWRAAVPLVEAKTREKAVRREWKKKHYGRE